MGATDQRLLSDIERLHTLERPELIGAWQKAYKAPPLKGARNNTLIRGLAHQMQCRAYGALKTSSQRQLLKIAANQQSGAELPMPLRKPKRLRAQPGTQLVREWNGKTHTVHVTEKGCVMGGVTYSSLSAAAKAITGAHWSGPRFFGVCGSAS